jgi:death-on-curing protein
VTDADPLLFLSVDEVLELHSHQLHLFGGSDGLRDPAALDSAVATPAASFGGQFLHSNLFHMAAAYAFHIAQNQPFLDGNKRTALNAALVFLDINGWLVPDPDELLFDAMIAIAERRLDKDGLAALFEKLAVQDDGSA